MNIRPGGAELFGSGIQADRHDKANSRCSKFCRSAYKLSYF